MCNLCHSLLMYWCNWDHVFYVIILVSFVSFSFFLVKGLQVLATFPGCYLPISEDVYRYILVILMSIVTERFEDTFLWKLSVKVLIEIGSFIEKYHDSYRGISFNRIVVERIVSLFQHDDSTMPLALKLDAISEIGAIGVDYMSRVIKLLEEAILSKFLAVCVSCIGASFQ